MKRGSTARLSSHRLTCFCRSERRFPPLQYRLISIQSLVDFQLHFLLIARRSLGTTWRAGEASSPHGGKVSLWMGLLWSNIYQTLGVNVVRPHRAELPVNMLSNRSRGSRGSGFMAVPLFQFLYPSKEFRFSLASPSSPSFLLISRFSLRQLKNMLLSTSFTHPPVPKKKNGQQQQQQKERPLSLFL